MTLLQQPLAVQLLSMVVNRVQRPHCNNYCMQANKRTKQVECRFGFPDGQRLLASLEKLPHSKHCCFRGERNDSQINHYNRLLTVAWLANTDISPCTSLQQVVDYAAKYCSKSEKKSVLCPDREGVDAPGQGPESPSLLHVKASQSAGC